MCANKLTITASKPKPILAVSPLNPAKPQHWAHFIGNTFLDFGILQIALYCPWLKVPGVNRRVPLVSLALAVTMAVAFPSLVLYIR